uniref:Glutaredoxin n=1 Tax=Riquetophycus sp. TaxID=1897556 RepID=A0A1C9C865_9FLOR|nr:hypothetical protein Riqu_093 [Riquetophycus sp.]
MHNYQTNYQNYIKNTIQKHKILAFIKGNKLMPMCGFSNTVIQILNRFNIDYYTVNVLEDEQLKKEIKIYSQWPTIPQVYIDGKFIGGADIILNLYETQQLKELLEKALNN